MHLLDDETWEKAKSEEASAGGDRVLTNDDFTVHGRDEQGAQLLEGYVVATTTPEAPDGGVLTATVRWSEGHATANVMDGENDW